MGRSARCSSGWGGVLSSKRRRRGKGWGVCGFSEHTRLASCSEPCPCCTLKKRDRRSENRSMSLSCIYVYGGVLLSFVTGGGVSIALVNYVL